MEFFKILLILLLNNRDMEWRHVSQLGAELCAIAGDCPSWRHWLVDLCRAGYLESTRRGWYRITEAGQRYCREVCGQFERASSHADAINQYTVNSTEAHPSFESKSESESDVETELLELWRRSTTDKKKVGRILKKLMNLNAPPLEQVRAICSELWGAPEEIPPRMRDRFERSVEETLELLNSRG